MQNFTTEMFSLEEISENETNYGKHNTIRHRQLQETKSLRTSKRFLPISLKFEI